LQLVAKTRVSVLDFVPSVLAAVAHDLRNGKANRKRLETVRHVIVGGERIQENPVRHLAEIVPDAHFTNLYGTTETTIGSVSHHIQPGDSDIPLGRPIAGTWCAVVDEDFRPLPHGCEGQIILGGACIGLGYLDDRTSTEERFRTGVDDPCRLGKFFCTGDRGMIVADKVLVFLGRNDNQVKRLVFALTLSQSSV